jgi:hypothetical protein
MPGGSHRHTACSVPDTMYTPARALAELKAQHDMLRGMMDRCEELADELDAARCGPSELTREIARLRLAFEAHNQFEEQLLRPVLIRSLDPATVERAIEQHVGDHRAMRLGLTSTETSPLREVIASMRDHLEAEERYLFSVAAAPVASAAE